MHRLGCGRVGLPGVSVCLPLWTLPSANLSAVKLLRIWLLVLLAVLLPVRGTMAAAMLCLPAAGGTPSEMPLMEHDGAGHHDHASHEAAGHDHGGHHDQSKFSQDDCDLCAAFCSVTPLASATPVVVASLDPPTTTFPDLLAPAPSFLSGGQERPPRSI